MDQTMQRDGSHGAAATLPVAAPVARLADHPAIRWLSLAVRVFLGITFLVAGAEKLVALPTFGHAIADYQLLPESLSNIFALSFVWTEIVVGVLLLAGVAIRGSALVTSAMLIVFLVAVISAIARGMTIDCGCFAGNSEPVGPKKVIEDLLLLAAAIFLIYFPKSYLTLTRLLRREWELGER
ncbi:MAG: MauE/DoxX family redox-associated membrane protein [Candidatus Kapaibacterium sp.]